MMLFFGDEMMQVRDLSMIEQGRRKKGKEN